ncbi:MAG TPA: hypothetical protein VHV74_11605 [Pseudonocardiaceae bacterium]|nr:hypothetical protein [Pseudonocardiaceae bacterium]
MPFLVERHRFLVFQLGGAASIVVSPAAVGSALLRRWLAVESLVCRGIPSLVALAPGVRRLWVTLFGRELLVRLMIARFVTTSELGLLNNSRFPVVLPVTGGGRRSENRWCATGMVFGHAGHWCPAGPQALSGRESPGAA